MTELQWFHGLYLVLAIVLEVIANLFIKYSDGFRKRILGILGIVCILAAFSSLAQAVKGIDLSVAYAIWGSFGILATVALSWILFQQRLKPTGWIGMFFLIIGMSLLKLA